jgi:predicted deacylase
VSKADPRNVPITVGDITVPPGKRAQFDLPAARLPTGTWMSLPVSIVNGRRPGPTIWLSGAVHGDEINGVAIIRRVMGRIVPSRLRGAVLAVPIVNVFGFINESRYLPDRRDLNRSFPGSSRGSLAARLAHLFLTEIVGHCDLGIDLHTAAGHRINHPQVRGDLSDPQTRELAVAFGAPFLIDAKVRDGSLRQAAAEQGKPILVYEAGQVQRFDENAIATGVDGIFRLMESLGMGSWDAPPVPAPPIEIGHTSWVRARRGGIAELECEMGELIDKGTTIATISDSFGAKRSKVTAPMGGWVIAQTQNPLVSQGDALVHVAAAADQPTPPHREPPPDAGKRSRRPPDADRR